MALRAKTAQPAKTAAIEDAKKVLSSYENFIFANYRGLTVEQITKLRRSLSEKEAQLKVIKNNFARIAFNDMKVEGIDEYLTGPTVITMGKGEANEVAKVLFEFAKEVPAFEVKGAYVGSEVYDKAKIEALSKLPGKKQLIAMLMSAINGPARQLAATLQAYVDKKQSEGGAEAAPAPAAE